MTNASMMRPVMAVIGFFIEAGVFIGLALADSCKRSITAAWREDYYPGNHRHLTNK